MSIEKLNSLSLQWQILSNYLSMKVGKKSLTRQNGMRLWFKVWQHLKNFTFIFLRNRMDISKIIWLLYRHQIKKVRLKLLVFFIIKWFQISFLCIDKPRSLRLPMTLSLTFTLNYKLHRIQSHARRLAAGNWQRVRVGM